MEKSKSEQLDMIYIEDQSSYRDHWNEKSKFYGISTKCYENFHVLINDSKVVNSNFAKVIVTDYDLGHQINGADIGTIVKSDYSYTGPLVMSSNCRRNFHHFDMDIAKANVIEVIAKYFPEKLDGAKKKLLSTPIKTWSPGELGYACSQGWINIPHNILVKEGILEKEITGNFDLKKLEAWFVQNCFTIFHSGKFSIESRSPDRGIRVLASKSYKKEDVSIKIFTVFPKIEELKSVCDCMLEMANSISVLETKPEVSTQIFLEKKKALIFRKDERVFDCANKFSYYGFKCTCVRSFKEFKDNIEKHKFDIIVVGYIFHDCNLSDLVDFCYKKSSDSYLICSSVIPNSVPDWFLKSGGDLILKESSTIRNQHKVEKLFDSPSRLSCRKKIELHKKNQVKKAYRKYFYMFCVTSLILGLISMMVRLNIF